MGIKINPPNEINELKGNVIILTTGSRLKSIKNQITNIVKSKKSAITTCEEMAFPLDRKIKKEINLLARKNKVVVLGTGVNPGFVSDSLILYLSAAYQEIKNIAAERIVDVSKRRIQLQKKVGVGLTRKEFHSLLKNKRIGHIGLKESVAMIASGLGWKLNKIKEDIKPVMRRKKVIGIKQTAYGTKNSKKNNNTEFANVCWRKTSGKANLGKNIGKIKEIIPAMIIPCKNLFVILCFL